MTKYNSLQSTLFLSTIMSISLLTACSKAVDSQPVTTQAKPSEPLTIAQPLASLDIANPSTFTRQKQPIYISYYDLGLDSQNTATDTNIPLWVKHNNQLIASQAVDNDADGQLDGLLVLVDLAPSASIKLDIWSQDGNDSSATDSSNLTSVKLTQADLSVKKGGQWVPHTKPPRHNPKQQYQEYIGGQFEHVTEVTPPAYYTDHSNWIRYEGPGLESDKVAYRFYLDWRNGFDIFGKRTSEPVLQQVGLDGYDSYHQAADWGMDILKVGNSLGAGGFGLLAGDKQQTVERVSFVDSWTAKITANGALQSSIAIDYNGWQNSINKQDLQAKISIQGGSRLAKVNLKLTQDLPNMTAGIVKHPDIEFIQGNQDITGDAYTYIASFGQQSLDGSQLGMAVFYRKNDLMTITEDANNYLVKLKPKGQSGQQSINYYFAAAWQVESGINDRDDFVRYLDQEAEKLTLTPRVRLKTQLSIDQQQAPLTAESALNWSVKLADAELARKALGYHYAGWDVNRQRLPKFEYDIVGLLPFAYDELAKATGNNEYTEVLPTVTASFVTADGDIRRYKLTNFNIDSIAPGRNLIRLYQQTQDPKYRQAATLLRQQLEQQPRTSAGAFWHKQKYPHQFWLDGVYMGMPFLTEYALAFESGEQQQHSLQEVINEFLLTQQQLKDPVTGLYYHAWDEQKQQDWAEKNTGLSAHFWARGMGWLTMAIVDVLPQLPAEPDNELSVQREQLIAMVNDIADSLSKVQDPHTGTWWQILDRPNAMANYRESSATAMFTYFYAKAINQGYLSDKYRPIALKAYQGLLAEFTLSHADGSTSMTNQCYVAGLGFGRNGSYEYYMNERISSNDPKGTGPYILAGIEISRLLQSDTAVK
ncbi:glycoside hydrolase family 88 protein [Shewanella sp. A14]